MNDNVIKYLFMLLATSQTDQQTQIESYLGERCVCVFNETVYTQIVVQDNDKFM